MSRISKDESRAVEAAILEATVIELARHGFAGLRVPAVAQAIGKTQGAVYGRFADKRALAVAALRVARDEHFVPLIAKALDETSAGRFAALERMSASLADLATANPAAERMIARLAAEAAHEEEPLRDEVRGLLEPFVGVIEAVLAAGQVEGEVDRALDVNTLARVVVAAQLGVSIMANLFADQTSVSDLAACLAPILTRGIRPA